MADGSHKALGATHVPRIRVGEDLGDAGDGFAGSSGGHDRGDLWRLAGANYLVNPKHVVPNEVSSLLNCAFVRKGERFLLEMMMRLTPLVRVLRVYQNEQTLTDAAAKP